MSQSQTSGYDILVQLSEEELNNQLAANFAPITIVVSTAPLVTATLVFDHLELDVDDTIQPDIENCVLLFLKTVFGQPVTIRIATPLGVFPSTGQRALGIYTYDPNPVDPNMDVPKVDIVLPLTGLNWLEPVIRAKIQQMGAFIPIAPIPISTGSDPLDVTDVHVKVIDAPLNGIDCVTFMLNRRDDGRQLCRGHHLPRNRTDRRRCHALQPARAGAAHPAAAGCRAGRDRRSTMRAR